MGKFHGQQVYGDKLRGICLGGCHGDLRPGPGVHHIVRLSGNGAAHYVYDPQHSGAPFLGLPQGSQCIGRLSGLADDNDQGPVVQDRIPVAELAGQVHIHLDPGQAFKNIFAGVAHVGRRSAGDHHDLADPPNLFVGHPQFFNLDLPVLDPGRKCIGNRFGLFIHFF